MTSFVNEEVHVTQKNLSDKLTFYTESKKSPPAHFKYYFETLGFYNVTLTLNFQGSTNFELTENDSIDPKNNLKVILKAGPRSKSTTVLLRQQNIKKGGSLSMNISYTIEKPDLDASKQFLGTYENEMKNEIELGKQMFPIERISSFSYPQIQQHFFNYDNKPFIDTTFPPISVSLFNGHEKTDDDASAVGCEDPLLLSNGTPIVWSRPADFMKSGTIELFKAGIGPEDIKQGSLGNFSISYNSHQVLLVEVVVVRSVTCMNCHWIVWNKNEFA